MSDDPLVTVVLAVQNGERFLAQAIDSVIAQTYQPFELLVVDGESGDGTEAIARSYSQVQYLRQRGRGWANGFNSGIDVARGDLIAFQSSDDLWLPNKLEKQVEYLVGHPETQYALAWFKYFLEPDCRIPASFKRQLLEKHLVGRVMETLVARRKLFDLIGKLDDGYRVADVDWFLRAKDRAVPMYVVPEVLLHKRVHDTNLTYSAGNAELLDVLKLSILRQRRQHPTKGDDNAGP